MKAIIDMKHPGALCERLREFTRSVIPAVLMTLTILINPVDTRAEPFNYRGCAWPLELSPEGSGNVQGPDGAFRAGLVFQLCLEHPVLLEDGRQIGVPRVEPDGLGAEFILQLGDFCWPHPRNKDFLEAWNAFAGARYHVLGNHDMDGGYKREQTVAYYGTPGRYHTFDAGPMRGIVLDSNDPGGKARGYKKFIAADQQAWLADALRRTDRPACVFIHHPLDQGGGIENGGTIRAILEQAEAANPDIVLAVFSGHFHQDHALEINGVRYVQINSASYVWLPEGAARETYPSEVRSRI